MRTRWPPRVSSSTPTGVRATRDSCVLISLGTPTTYFSPAGIAEARPCAPGFVRQRRVHSGKEGQGNQGQPAGGKPNPSPQRQQGRRSFGQGGRSAYQSYPGYVFFLDFRERGRSNQIDNRLSLGEPSGAARADSP